MCFPQQKLVLHWLSLLTHKLNWTIQTLFLYKNPANVGPSQVICSRSTTKWITLKLQANFSGILWSFPGVEAESFESWYSWFLFFCLNDSWLLQEFSSRFMIHEEFWSPHDWLNGFLRGNLVSFCIVSLVFKPLFSSRVGIISYRYCITRYSVDQVCSFL